MSFINLTNRLAKAQSTLTASFGISQKEQAEGFDVYKYLSPEGLAEAYVNDVARKDISEQLLTMAKSIKRMRSSYLPIDFFLSEIKSDALIRDIQGSSSSMEPYENAFMRMLGMPALSDFQYGLTQEYSKVSSEDLFYVVNPETSSLELQNFQTVSANIIAQRKKSGKQRRFFINNSIYNISADINFDYYDEDYISILNFTDKEKADLLSLSYDGNTGVVSYIDPSGIVTEVDVASITEIVTDKPGGSFINPITNQPISSSKIAAAPLPPLSTPPAQANILNLSEDLYKFSYLLFPPIQDPAIANAINEPEKLVLPPFSSPINKKVNATSPKPSLLESVIRIRLDRVSGTSSQFATDLGIDPADLDGSSVSSDDYGVLESLFIVRLISAILGLSTKMVHDIDVLIDEMDKARRQIEEGDPDSDADSNNRSIESGLSFSRGDQEEDLPDVGEESLASDAALENVELSEDSDDDSSLEDPDSRAGVDIPQSSLVNLQNQKLIEDSLMFLLADTSEVLDLQAQTQRSSGIYNSHMMSGLINIIDVPRKRIKSEIDKIKESRDQAAASEIEGKAQEISTTLGTDIGIGTLDLAVVALALFSLSEDSLLGLLSEAQFERIKNGEFKELIPEDAVKKNVVDSVNELSLLIFEGYELFKSGLIGTTRMIPTVPEEEGA